MGFFSSIGNALKSGLGFVGDVAKKAAPFVGLIPGVGTLAGGAIGGLGSLASDVGHGRSISLSDALKSGATGALSGLGGGLLSKLGGGGSALSGAKNLLLGGGGSSGSSGSTDLSAPAQPDFSGINVPDASSLPAGSSAAPTMNDLPGSTGARIPRAAVPAGRASLLSSIGNYIGKNPLQAAQLGLAAANVGASSAASGKANALRSQALTRVQQPTAVDLSKYFQSGNPYARVA